MKKINQDNENPLDNDNDNPHDFQWSMHHWPNQDLRKCSCLPCPQRASPFPAPSANARCSQTHANAVSDKGPWGEFGTERWPWQHRSFYTTACWNKTEKTKAFVQFLLSERSHAIQEIALKRIDDMRYCSRNRIRRDNNSFHSLLPGFCLGHHFTAWQTLHLHLASATSCPGQLSTFHA